MIGRIMEKTNRVAATMQAAGHSICRSRGSGPSGSSPPGAPPSLFGVLHVAPTHMGAYACPLRCALTRLGLLLPPCYLSIHAPASHWHFEGIGNLESVSARHGEQRTQTGMRHAAFFKNSWLSTVQANATSPTLQESQTHALLTLLNLNNHVEPSSSPIQPSGKSTNALKVSAPSGPPVWKVLVLDQYTKDVLATVLRVQDLRDVGVTLHV